MFAKLVRRATESSAEKARAAAAPTPPETGAAAETAAATPPDGLVAAAEQQARERLRAFAFASADMLLETAADGTIQFATGAFDVRFGAPPASFIGQKIGRLIAPGDQTAFAMALSMMPLRGRIAPIVLHMSDSARTPASVSAMLIPGPPPRLCFNIGPVPSLPPMPDEDTGSMQHPAQFAREAEALLRAGGNGRLGMVEVIGWQAVKERLPAAEQLRLRAAIGAMMGDAVPGARASELAEGRFGVLAAGDTGMEKLLRNLDHFLGRSPARGFAKVAGTEMALDAGDLSAATAGRVLRYAVSRFTGEGAAAVAAVGGGGGLAGVLAQAELRSQAVRAALIAHRFRLVFQPVVALDTRKVHHYEALLRPTQTIGMPAQSTQEFVTFAEAVGLSEVLDYAVLEQALVALRAAPAAAVAVNMSGLSLQSVAFRDRVMALIGQARDVLDGPAPSRLLVELTETAEIDDMATASDTIARLRGLGVPMSLDDFGAGASAFRYLREFKVDYVKIDGSFVRAATAGARERSLVASMVELAASAGARTVAEMIETEEEAALMRKLGVDQGQGWLFGRPGGLPGMVR